MNTLNTDMTSLIHTINTGNTITTTTTASSTDPFYVRPPIGHKPVPSILDGPNVDPAMLNWRTRERQWELEELDREKQIEILYKTFFKEK